LRAECKLEDEAAKSFIASKQKAVECICTIVGQVQATEPNVDFKESADCVKRFTKLEHKLRQFASYAPNRDEELGSIGLMSIICKCIIDPNAAAAIKEFQSKRKLKKEQHKILLSGSFNTSFGALAKLLSNGDLLDNKVFTDLVTPSVDEAGIKSYADWAKNIHTQVLQLLVKPSVAHPRPMSIACCQHVAARPYRVHPLGRLSFFVCRF
jgi:hypothetical protein